MSRLAAVLTCLMMIVGASAQAAEDDIRAREERARKITENAIETLRNVVVQVPKPGELAHSLQLANPECEILLKHGESVGLLQTLLADLGLNDAHRIVLDGARGLPVLREAVTVGRNEPSPIRIERLIAHPQAEPLPFLRIEPVSTGSVYFDLMMKTNRAAENESGYFGVDTVDEVREARQAYMHEQRQALLEGDVTEFLQGVPPQLRITLRLNLPPEAREFLDQPNHYVRFSAATRVEILRRMGLFEAAAKVNTHSNYYGTTVVEDVLGIELHRKSMTYSFYPRLMIPRQLTNTEFVGHILFYSALHHHLVSHYPEALRLPLDFAVRVQPPTLTAEPDTRRRLLGRKPAKDAPVVRTAEQIQREYNASVTRAEPDVLQRFHVETDIGPFTIEGFSRRK